jgi:YVTN family beta-propeller protein
MNGRRLRFGFALAFASTSAATVVGGDEVTTAHAPFVNFESGPVNGLLLSPDGQRLFVTNTSDHRIEIFRWQPTASPQAPSPNGKSGVIAGGTPGAGSTLLGGAGSGPAAPWIADGAVFTGLDPVALALDPAQPQRLFVANHVSDTVSVVDLGLRQVVATLQVGDEPNGLTLAQGRLFVACARAPATPLAPGQRLPGAFDEHCVAVFAATPPYAWIANVVVPGFAPRDVVAIGGTVYVIPQHSGNKTTLLDETKTKQAGLEQWTPDAFDPALAWNPVLLRPELNATAFPRGWYVPNAGRIVFDSEFPTQTLSLQDADVIAIDAQTLVPHPTPIQGVGTSLFDLERNPATGDLWVAAQDARNRVRFEPNLRGQAIENRVARIDLSSAAVQHLELAPPLLQAPLAQPAVLGFHVAGSQALAYVACVGSSAVAVLDARSGAGVTTLATGPIPAGLAVDSERHLLHVYCRGDATVRTYDIARRHAPLGAPTRLGYDPEPPAVREGRVHLYSANGADGHGNGSMSCASCHHFGHADQLAWDLGDPTGAWGYYFPDVLDGFGSYPGAVVAAPTTPILHPLKGPMVTQSLRGLVDADGTDDLPLHWRGDRRTFQTFRGAFQSLLGGSGISELAMQEFATFVRAMRVPPNPHQPKDRAYVGLEATGKDTYGLTPGIPGKPYSGAGVACALCHQADFVGKTNFTGARPVASAGSFSQLFQTAQLRQAYEKDDRELTGFGLLHDGAVDGVRGFMDFVVPNGGAPTFPNFTPTDKDTVSAFVKAFDSGMPPLVGAQFTLDAATAAQATAFLDLAEAMAQAPHDDIDVIVKGFRLDAQAHVLPRGGVFVPGAGAASSGYAFDSGVTAPRSLLIALASAGIGTFTFTCVPRANGVRLGVDRDEDGVLDLAEVAAGTDPDRADTDHDGYTDAFELALGADPRTADVTLQDGAAPVISESAALDVFHDAATVVCVTDEPALVRVDAGSAPGLADFASATRSGLHRRHALHLVGLPARTTVFARITATDRNGNVALRDLSFATMPPFVHVDALTLTSSGTPAVTLTATVRIVDAHGQPIQDITVLVFFSGDLGGQPWQRLARTDANGVATFVLTPFTPQSGATVAVSPVFVGSLDPQDPWFVGKGGDASPAHYYEQPANVVNFASITFP